MHFLKQALYSLVLLCACAVNGFATPLFIQSGTWIVDSELNGLPGRGMAIDVQNQHLVMQVYNYNRAGQPTFHLASGPLDGLQFKGPLVQYRGGRFFGSGERVGREDQVAGEVRMRFVSSTSGFIQFPGESEVAMSRFRFYNAPEGFVFQPNSEEDWLAMEYDEKDNPLSAWHLGLVQAAGPELSLYVISSAKGERAMYKSDPCTYKTGGWIRCEVIFGEVMEEQKTAVFEIRRSVNGLDGNITRVAFPGLVRKLRGNRNSFIDYAAAINYRLLYTKESQSRYAYAPEPGTWVISRELNGKPGRGMALDWQNGMVVMQVYNYEQNGDPSFHLAVGKVSDSPPFETGVADFTARLKRYEGGRYFGSGAVSGHEAADVGEVQLSFSSPLTGRVKFPGESWVSMEKFQFGYGKSNPESLIGQWTFQNVAGESYWFELSKIEGKYAVGEKTRCHFLDREEIVREYRGNVRCVVDYQNPENNHIFVFDFSTEFRAVAALSYKRILGSIQYPEKGFAVQVRDKNGTPIGFGRVDQ